MKVGWFKLTDKMMRNAGLGEDGSAKALRTTNEGFLKTALTGSNILLDRKTNITVPAGANIWLYNDDSVKNTGITAVSTQLFLSEPSSFRLELWNYRGESYESPERQENVSYYDESSINPIFHSKTPYHRLRLVNNSDVEITVSFAVSFGMITNYGLVAVSKDKNNPQMSNLTYEADDNGNAVLRTVNVSPVAYDAFEDAFKVRVISDVITNKELYYGSFLVGAGSEKYYYNNLPVEGYSKIFISVKTTKVTDFDLNIRRKGSGGNYVAKTETISVSDYLYQSDPLYTKSNLMEISIKNNDTEDLEYEVSIFGVI